MKLIFERSKKGRRGVEIPECAIEEYGSEYFSRTEKAELPEIAEVDLVRHYTELSRMLTE